MENRAIVERIMKNLAFEVETVPKKTNDAATTSSNIDPLNVKIKIRKKEMNAQYNQGFISNNQSVPEMFRQKVRLVSSDATIMSFDVFMEAESDKKASVKPHKYIFNKLKPALCFGVSDDDRPRVPDSNKGLDGSSAGKSILDKNASENLNEPKIKKKENLFLGKRCKPGGCLDPPFSEDRYSYQPSVPEPLNNDSIASENGKLDKTCVENETDDKHYNKSKNKNKNQSVSINQEDNKIEKSDSILSLYNINNSVITYPPDSIDNNALRARVSSETKKRNNGKDVKASIEDKSRSSINESMNSFFSPPKRIKKDSQNDVQQNETKYNSYTSNSKKNEAMESSIAPTTVLLNASLKQKLNSDTKDDTEPTIFRQGIQSTQDDLYETTVTPGQAHSNVKSSTSPTKAISQKSVNNKIYQNGDDDGISKIIGKTGSIISDGSKMHLMGPINNKNNIEQDAASGKVSYLISPIVDVEIPLDDSIKTKNHLHDEKAGKVDDSSFMNTNTQSVDILDNIMFSNNMRCSKQNINFKPISGASKETSVIDIDVTNNSDYNKSREINNIPLGFPYTKIGDQKIEYQNETVSDENKPDILVNNNEYNNKLKYNRTASEFQDYTIQKQKENDQNETISDRHKYSLPVNTNDLKNKLEINRVPSKLQNDTIQKGKEIITVETELDGNKLFTGENYNKLEVNSKFSEEQNNVIQIEGNKNQKIIDTDNIGNDKNSNGSINELETNNTSSNQQIETMQNQKEVKKIIEKSDKNDKVISEDKLSFYTNGDDFNTKLDVDSMFLELQNDTILKRKQNYDETSVDGGGPNIETDNNDYNIAVNIKSKSSELLNNAIQKLKEEDKQRIVTEIKRSLSEFQQGSIWDINEINIGEDKPNIQTVSNDYSTKEYINDVLSIDNTFQKPSDEYQIEIVADKNEPHIQTNRQAYTNKLEIKNSLSDSQNNTIQMQYEEFKNEVVLSREKCSIQTQNNENKSKEDTNNTLSESVYYMVQKPMDEDEIKIVTEENKLHIQTNSRLEIKGTFLEPQSNTSQNSQNYNEIVTCGDELNTQTINNNYGDEVDINRKSSELQNNTMRQQNEEVEKEKLTYRNHRDINEDSSILLYNKHCDIEQKPSSGDLNIKVIDGEKYLIDSTLTEITQDQTQSVRNISSTQIEDDHKNSLSNTIENDYSKSKDNTSSHEDGIQILDTIDFSENDPLNTSKQLNITGNNTLEIQYDSDVVIETDIFQVTMWDKKEFDNKVENVINTDNDNQNQDEHSAVQNKTEPIPKDNDFPNNDEEILKGNVSPKENLKSHVMTSEERIDDTPKQAVNILDLDSSRSLVDKKKVVHDTQISSPLKKPNPKSIEPKTIAQRPQLQEKKAELSKDQTKNTLITSNMNNNLEKAQSKIISLNLAFHSYITDKSETIFETITDKEVNRYPNNSITLIKSQIKLSGNKNYPKLSIPIDSKFKMDIKVKKTMDENHIEFDKTKPLPGNLPVNVIASNTNETKYYKTIVHNKDEKDEVHGTLIDIYKQELLPLQTMIKDLKHEIDEMTEDLTCFKKQKCLRKIKPARPIHSNRKCCSYKSFTRNT